MSPSAPGIEEIKCLEESLAKGHEWLEKALRAGLPERASFWELVLAKNLVCKKIKKKIIKNPLVCSLPYFRKK